MRNVFRNDELTLPAEIWRLALNVYLSALYRCPNVDWFCLHIKRHLAPKGAAYAVEGRCRRVQFREGPAALKLLDLDIVARLVSHAITCGIKTLDVQELAAWLMTHGHLLAPDRRGVLTLKLKLREGIK